VFRQVVIYQYYCRFSAIFWGVEFAKMFTIIHMKENKVFQKIFYLLDF